MLLYPSSRVRTWSDIWKYTHVLDCSGGIVALGKFEALHIGHRELAIQASKIGVPYLLSFVGMAEVLGWEPRAPIVAKCDRHRVLSSWAPYCGNVVPAEFQVEFSNVRHLTPRQFVEKLCKELEVTGVVAGENYRFGYKAAGDTRELTQLCKEFGIQACIINSVMDKHQDPSKLDLNDFKDKGQVSSTRVRHALAAGDMEYVTELLGRRHRLMLTLNGFARDSSRRKISAPRSSLLNLPPKDGFYGNCSVFVGEVGTSCRVLIESSGIHIEVEDDAVGFSSDDDWKHLGIEFGN
ncbi:FAD synthetase 2, chloroplastic [Linum perenne]